jgi:hypothetical protein
MTDALEARALRMWREREMTFPKFTRRMTPDRLDINTGAWARMLAEARLAEGTEAAPVER